VNLPERSRELHIGCAGSWLDAYHLKGKLLVVGLSIALICVVVLGVLRMFQDLIGNTISPWRLVLFLGNALLCVSIACALYARGRRPQRRGYIGLKRS